MILQDFNTKLYRKYKLFKKYTYYVKSIHFRKVVFSLYESKVLQGIPGGVSLERFGKKDLGSIK